MTSSSYFWNFDDLIFLLIEYYYIISSMLPIIVKSGININFSCRCLTLPTQVLQSLTMNIWKTELSVYSFFLSNLITLTLFWLPLTGHLCLPFFFDFIWHTKFHVSWLEKNKLFFCFQIWRHYCPTYVLNSNLLVCYLCLNLIAFLLVIFVVFWTAGFDVNLNNNPISGLWSSTHTPDTGIWLIFFLGSLYS